MKNLLDRRKNNYNLLILMILLLFFGIVIYNQRLIISTHDHVIEINKKIDQFFLPVLDVEPTEWENNH